MNGIFQGGFEFEYVTKKKWQKGIQDEYVSDVYVGKLSIRGVKPLLSFLWK